MTVKNMIDNVDGNQQTKRNSSVRFLVQKLFKYETDKFKYEKKQ